MTNWLPSRTASSLRHFGTDRGRRTSRPFLRELAVLLSLCWPACAGTPDSTLLEVRSYVHRWLTELPNVLCLQTTARFSLDLREMWRRDELSRAELTVERGGERYRLLSFNGRPPGGSQPAASQLLGSSGEFLSAVRELFDPASKAEFRRRGTRNERGRSLCRYDFRIRQANSQWYVGVDPAYRPAYSGSIWVNALDGALIRIEMKTRSFPDWFRIRSASMNTEFEPIPLNGTPLLLPSRSEVIVFASWGYAERRVISYSNYRRFTAASHLLPSGSE